MSMAQVGILSLSQLQLHDHSNANTGGAINTVARATGGPVKITSGAMRSTLNAAMTLLKRVIIRENSPGSMDLNYDVTRTGSAGNVNAQARIYRAGAAIWNGVLNNEVAGPTTFSDPNIVLDLLAGDTIEIWGQRVTAGAVCEVTDLEIAYTGTITRLSDKALFTPLVLTAAADILYTVIS